MQLPKAITLDLDDTLWPIAPTIAQAERASEAWFAEHAPGVLSRFDAEGRRAVREAILREHPQRAHDLSWVRHELFARLLAAAGHDPALATPAFAHFFAARQQVRLFAEAGAALARLSARLPVAALSNGNADLAQIGIEAHFAFSLSARDYGAAKPDPGIFREAARRLGVAPEDVLHVGDDVHTDVFGAHRAGLRTAWINREAAPWPAALAQAEVQPTLIVRDLAELAELLDAAAGR